MMPTPIQAQTMWLNAMGWTAAEIAQRTGRTAISARQALTEARRVATACGLRMVVNEVPLTTELGFTGAKKLAKEAGLLP